MTDRLLAQTVDRLSKPMRWATFTAWGLALVATVAANSLGNTAGVIALGVVIAAPLVRVAALIVVWSKERDYRFVVTAILLLAIIGAGALIALLT